MILVGHNAALDTTGTENDLEMKRQAEETKLHRMAKVHNFLEMWQGSQNLCATQKESCTQNKHMTAVGYISATGEIVRASWSNFQHDGAAAFTLSERSPLPPALSAKYLPGRQTQILNVHRITWINRHAAKCDDDCAPDSISNNQNWINWNGDLHDLNQSEDDWVAHYKSNVELDNGFEDPKSPEQQDASTALTSARLIQPTQWSKKKAEKLLTTVNAIDTRRNKGNKTK